VTVGPGTGQQARPWHAWGAKGKGIDRPCVIQPLDHLAIGCGRARKDGCLLPRISHTPEQHKPIRPTTRQQRPIRAETDGIDDNRVALDRVEETPACRLP